jgi:hypothetical protein
VPRDLAVPRPVLGEHECVPYPPRPHLKPLPQFAGGGRPGVAADATLKRFVIEQYRDGRSLREIAELTNRSFGACRNILQRAGELRRGVGAAPLDRTP